MLKNPNMKSTKVFGRFEDHLWTNVYELIHALMLILCMNSLLGFHELSLHNKQPQIEHA